MVVVFCIDGNEIIKQDPWSTSLVTVIFPPCSSTISFTIDNPKPVPPVARDLALSTR